MRCPRCETRALEELDREGLTIDRCPGCRGVWLDRGELEKLIARSDPADGMRDTRDPGSRDWDDDDDHDERSGRYGHEHGTTRKRRWFESLGEIFD